MKTLWCVVGTLLLVLVSARAQDARVVAVCGTLPQAYASGSTQMLTVDTSGRLCLNFNNITLPINFVSGSFSETWSFRANGEMELSANNAGLNVLAFKNTNAGGFSAVTFLDTTDTEKGACGYGNVSVGAIFQGMYCETSDLGHVSAPKPLRLVSTGVLNSVYGNYGRLEIDSTTGTTGNILTFLNLTGAADVVYDAVAGTLGIKKTGKTTLDVLGPATFNLTSVDNSGDAIAAVNAIGGGGSGDVLNLEQPGIVKTHVQILGTNNASADRRVTFRNTDNGNAEVFSISLSGVSQTQMLSAQVGFAGSSTLLNLATGEFGLAKIAATGTAPGAAGGKLELVCGTGVGTAKIIVYAGTGTTPTTMIDNIGIGVTGC